MKKVHTIIIGGGPGGSACAWMLRQHGIDVLILDKTSFPRQKICAGWITPGVFRLLGIAPEDYPFSIKRFDRLHFHVKKFHFPIKTTQYAIRRIEFDQWLLSKAAVPMETHQVKNIVRKNKIYEIDDRYQCQFLVGAGGTHCPVYASLFKHIHPRSRRNLIVAVEKEYQSNAEIDQCHLWFFIHRLPGYAWILPKGDQWINIGIGGKQKKLKNQRKTIIHHWQMFTQMLQKMNILKEIPQHPKGHTYYLYHGGHPCHSHNAFIIGDAAGLSTIDMGEGIHAAVKSGFEAAKAIINETELPHYTVPRLSLPRILF